MEALWLHAIIVKETDMLNSDLKARQQLINVKYVTRLAKQRRANTTPQSWDDGFGRPTFYYGPPLDVSHDESFKNYKIHPKQTDIQRKKR